MKKLKIHCLSFVWILIIAYVICCYDTNIGKVLNITFDVCLRALKSCVRKGR